MLFRSFFADFFAAFLAPAFFATFGFFAAAAFFAAFGFFAAAFLAAAFFTGAGAAPSRGSSSLAWWLLGGCLAGCRCRNNETERKRIK